MRKISSPRPFSTRPVPQRTCVACRQVKSKREMVRLVRTRAGDIEIDTLGKKDGRGAYLCPDWKCWEKALKSKQLEYALRGNLTQDNREQLIKQGKELLKEMNSG